jgi:hypothetical protein
MATSGLAVTLAYVVLDRFRYRREIEDAASVCYQKYSALPLVVGEKVPAYWKEVQWLCRKSSEKFKPAGFWGGVYKRLFRGQIDFGIIVALAIFSGGTLAVGVALNLHIWSGIRWANTATAARISFYICLLATTFPFLAMYGGHRCARWGRLRADFCDRELLLYQGREAAEVLPPLEDLSGSAPAASK